MSKQKMKRKMKDSVFTALFRQTEYLLQLYQVLHPEDQSITEDDLKLITLENVLSDGLYNDLGFQVRDQLILLVEAQSTFSPNIVMRALLYLAKTYDEYIEEHQLNLYSSAAVQFPGPELYMLFTGEKKIVPETLYLSNLFSCKTDYVEAKVDILCQRGTNDIIDQYAMFCDVANEQRKKYGYTPEATKEVVRICLERGILVPFLQSRKKEVFQVMDSLFDQERVTNNLVRDAQKKALEEGRKEGREEGIASAVLMLRQLGTEKETAVRVLTKNFSLLPEVATEKLNQYWNAN